MVSGIERGAAPRHASDVPGQQDGAVQTRRGEDTFRAQLAYFLLAPLFVCVSGAPYVVGGQFSLRGQSARCDREWLRWRRNFARRVAGGNGALFDAEDWLAGFAIEDEKMRGLGADADGGNSLAVFMDIEQNGRRGDVVIPQVVMDGLEIPDALTRIGA